MTEAEWLASAAPCDMVVAMFPNSPDRKFRLLGFAALDVVATEIIAAKLDPFLEAVERDADGSGTESEREQTLETLRNLKFSQPGKIWLIHLLISALHESDKSMDGTFCGPFIRAFNALDEVAGYQGVRNDPRGAALVRDIFGNPFRPVTFDPAWRTSDAVALAKGIYDDRAFDRLPILADALQDAGCANDDILNHCRGDGPHARGCWVVDSVLGKA